MDWERGPVWLDLKKLYPHAFLCVLLSSYVFLCFLWMDRRRYYGKVSWWNMIGDVPGMGVLVCSNELTKGAGNVGYRNKVVVLVVLVCDTKTLTR